MQVAASRCTAPAASVVFNALISCLRIDGVDLTLERFFSGCALRISALTDLCTSNEQIAQLGQLTVTVLYKISKFHVS